jgi:hypothetical protein
MKTEKPWLKKCKKGSDFLVASDKYFLPKTAQALNDTKRFCLAELVPPHGGKATFSK